MASVLWVTLRGFESLRRVVRCATGARGVFTAAAGGATTRKVIRPARLGGSGRPATDALSSTEYVPGAAPGRAEDDGWLLTITTRRDGSASQLLVLDATDVAGAPVAAVTLPRGVPSGFHGSWIADNAVDNGVTPS